MVPKFFCFIFFLYPVLGNNRTKRWKWLPEEGMTVPQLIKHYEYPLEIHKVVTEDGYELTMHRIPYGRRMTAIRVKRPAVFLQHGLAASASCWIANLPEQSLAFILADSGFDVWLGNARGNRYSQYNVNNVGILDKNFWDFSWEDMADYDLPAMINRILEITHHQQVSYIGHSQGTLVAIAKFSEDQTFAKKIKLFVALAPIARVGHITSVIRKLAPHGDMIQNLMDNTAQYSLENLIEYLDSFKGLCKFMLFQSLVCENIVSLIAGKEWQANLNKSRIEVYLSNNPEDTSVKNLAHFAQMINSGKMHRYDYGYVKNLQKYGQETPPEYNPEDVDVPTVAFWSPVDTLADETDVKWLLSKLKNVKDTRLDNYNHLDFVWALNAREMIYDKIVDLLKQKV